MFRGHAGFQFLRQTLKTTCGLIDTVGLLVCLKVYANPFNKTIRTLLYYSRTPLKMDYKGDDAGETTREHVFLQTNPTHTHTHPHTHTPTHPHTHARTHARTHPRTPARAQTRSRTRTHTHTHTLSHSHSVTHSDSHPLTLTESHYMTQSVNPKPYCLKHYTTWNVSACNEQSSRGIRIGGVL